MSSVPFSRFFFEEGERSRNATPRRGAIKRTIIFSLWRPGNCATLLYLCGSCETEIAPSLLFSIGAGHARVSSIFAKRKKFSSVGMIDYLWIFFIDRFIPAFSLYGYKLRTTCTGSVLAKGYLIHRTFY